MDFSEIIFDYAQLAANVYGAKVSVRSELNTVQLPEGWGQIDEKISQSGFMARAYRNAATGEVVVAYAGTTLEQGHALDDWITGNVPAGVGGFSQQVFEAIEFYLNVLSLPGVDPAKTSFTGHSLAGTTNDEGATVDDWLSGNIPTGLETISQSLSRPSQSLTRLALV
ncbi:hypothetical protein KWH04_01290 [Xanthomonas campestris pv. trichodesmae]|nr:hypothetical protein [Xanthomonas citri]MBV6779304.1 hypothetical protein [Xanthomonas campestris pv. trichodesmae]